MEMLILVLAMISRGFEVQHQTQGQNSGGSFPLACLPLETLHQRLRNSAAPYGSSVQLIKFKGFSVSS